MVVLLILGAVLAAAGSVLFVSEATLGVWAMAGAILLTALARISQAAEHHKAWLKSTQHQSPPEPHTSQIVNTDL